MKATWTYEVPPAGADSAGREDYLVETRDGEAAGKAIALLEREGERLLLFDTGTPPLARQRRAARWEDVAEIDHDTLTIRLRTELAGVLEVDPANEVEGGDAEAVRVTELPRELTRPAPRPGTDRSTGVHRRTRPLSRWGSSRSLRSPSQRAGQTSAGNSVSFQSPRS